MVLHWGYGVSQNMDLSTLVQLIHNLTTVSTAWHKLKKKPPELGFNPVYIHAELTSIHWTLTKLAVLNVLLCSHKHNSLCKREGRTLLLFSNKKIRLLHWCSYILTEGNPGPKAKARKTKC